MGAVFSCIGQNKEALRVEELASMSEARTNAAEAAQRRSVWTSLFEYTKVRACDYIFI